jgi:hypothetical protein
LRAIPRFSAHSRARRTCAAAVAHRAPPRLAVATPEARRGVRRALAVIPVLSPRLLEHPARFRLCAAARRHCAAAARAAAGCIPPLLACIRPEPPDRRSTVQITPSSLVKAAPYRSTTLIRRNRSPPPDHDPVVQIHLFSVGHTLLQIEPRDSPVLQPGPSTLEKTLQLGPVFFSLARKLKNSLQISPKNCFSHNFVVLAPFLAFFMSTRSSRRVE